MYQISGKQYSEEHPQLNEALAAVYGTSTRPLCMCREGGVEMYIAKMNGTYIIKRMPDSGGKHSVTCDSYEPPTELSGRGEVMGGAIQTDMSEGITNLKFDFSLSKSGSRAAPAKSAQEHDSVKSDGKKLTLRGTLHFLFDEAALTRWYPKMEGKRNWYVVRRALLGAAADKRAKGSQLGDMLYIPESFSMERKDEITHRRLSLFRTMSSQEGSVRKLMLLIGEVKEIGDARFGKKMVIKHLPDCHFMVNDDLHKRLLKRFETELSLWAGNESVHLLTIATFGVNSSGTASIEECSVMLVNENWIPFESLDERLLIDSLIKSKRRFVKGLRYNLPSTKVLASAVLNDTPEAVAMYIHPYGADEKHAMDLQELMAESEMASWQWNVAEAMPDFPDPVGSSNAEGGYRR
ncbi:MAG: hypothetical protein BGO63_03590 [Candidatus Accumulibacter sp. 66-26]|nr:MAG: hypothetical protein BGO63_03590 [Candidatus Accumulibacter sp. 66-26]